MKKIFCLIMIAVLGMCLISCGGATAENVWETAVYTEQTLIGSGSKTICVDVVAEGKTVEITVRTDKETLGDALSAVSLIQGEKGPYGLYVKKVNGIVADYDKNRAYWAIEKGGESVMTGVDGVQIADGEHYEFIYTK